MVTPFEFDEKSAMTDSEISYKRYEKYSLDISEETMSRETFMIEELVKEMAMRLMDERGFSMKEALDIVYNSETYSKVLDLRTGLFSQSTSYVYSILETEILTGKLG